VTAPSGDGHVANVADSNDRELWSVLVALEPLDSRKWTYLDLRDRTFHVDDMLQDSWSSGERALIEVAQSLWNDGKVDLGYLACALGPKHLQAVIDATAIRAGQPLASDTRGAIRRIAAVTIRAGRVGRDGGLVRDPAPSIQRTRRRELEL